MEDDKVWLISYKYGGHNPNDSKAWGMGDDQAAYEKVIAAARLGGNEEAMQAQQDWKLWTELFKIDPKEGEKGEYCRRQQAVLHMAVEKLKSGDLLLYCPVQIHEGTKLDTFLKDLGHVKYIVIGSCCHTNHIRSTTMRYPGAKVIGTKTAEIKLLAVNALTRKKLDFDLLDESQARQINEVLEPEGVIVYFTKGDLMTRSVFLLAHNTGCEVDLLYAHHDACTCGYRHAWCNSNKNANPEDFVRRLFKYLLITKPGSPFGYLPVYRFAGMDPTSTFSLMNWPRPAPDGSSCDKFAWSLRQLLKLDFKQVASVHSSLQSADDFRRSVDVDWNWLDGRSLLDK